MIQTLIEMMTHSVTVPVWVLLVVLICGAILPMVLNQILDDLAPHFGARDTKRTRSSARDRGRR